MAATPAARMVVPSITSASSETRPVSSVLPPGPTVPSLRSSSAHSAAATAASRAEALALPLPFFFEFLKTA